MSARERSRARPPSPARRGGFTMVELMIAMAVLLVAVLSAFSSQLTSAGLMATSRETDLALSELQGCMERVLLLPSDEIPVPGSLYESGRAVAAYQDLHLDSETIVATYPGYVLGGPVPDPLPILLTLTWNDYQGRPRRLELSSIKVR